MIWPINFNNQILIDKNIWSIKIAACVPNFRF
jgi:hypothetical protein